MDDQHLRWKVYGERTLYDNPWVRLVKVDVEPPDGNRFEHHVVRLQRIAITAAVDADDRVLMLWRHRFVTDELGWELPGGIVDIGEEASDTAAREVQEETGWRPNCVRHLLTFQPMIGMVDSPHELYVAAGAELVGEPSDPVEVGRVEWIPMGDVMGLIAKGEVLGSGSVVALLYLLAQRNSRSYAASRASRVRCRTDPVCRIVLRAAVACRALRSATPAA